MVELLNTVFWTDIKVVIMGENDHIWVLLGS